MKHNQRTSNLYSFVALLAILGLLALPVGCSHMANVGKSQGATNEEQIPKEEPDWTIAGNEAEEEEEPDWTLAGNEAEEEDETDWTLA